MAQDPRDVQQRRRQLFRRMEWAYVYAPPLIALFVGVFGAAFLAWAVKLRGTTFLLRWAIGVLVILVLPALVYWIRSRNEEQ